MTDEMRAIYEEAEADGDELADCLRDALAEIDRLRHLLRRVTLAVTNPDRDHVDRCVDVQAIVGWTEDWVPLNDGSTSNEGGGSVEA